MLMLRADASSSIGTGHWMRCIALGQSWVRSGGDALLVGSCTAESLISYAEGCGVPCRILTGSTPIETSTAILSDIAGRESVKTGLFGAWVVLDGYGFDGDSQKCIRDAGMRLLCIDDFLHAKHYYADIIVNPNGYAVAEDYALIRESYTETLAGTEYAVLRSEFNECEALDEREIRESVKNVLISFGGSDPSGMTPKILAALGRADLSGKTLRVVVGSGNLREADIRAAALGLSCDVEIVVDARMMTAHMLWADLAVSAAGTTTWEMARMGVPAMYYTVAANQMRVADYIAASEIGVSMGWADVFDVAEFLSQFERLLADLGRREMMSRNGRRLVDGAGCERIVRNIRLKSLGIRDVVEGDSKMIWDWANDEMVRRMSFNTAEITWCDHRKWFAAKIAAQSCFIFVISGADGKPIGQARFEERASRAVISISLGAAFRGMGLGALVIGKAVAEYFVKGNCDMVDAYIKVENNQSGQAFKSAGFDVMGTVAVAGHSAIHMSIAKERIDD